MKLSAILAPLIAAKVPHDIIMQTVQAWEAEQSDALEKRRSSDRDRQAKRRANNVTSRDVTVTQRDMVSPKKETSPTPPKEKTTPSVVSEPVGSSTIRPEPENSAPATQSPSVIDLPATQGQTVSITEADVAEWRDAFPAVDVLQQLRAMRQWLLANDKNRKTVRGMRKFVVSWLARDQDRGGARQHNGHQSQAPPRKTAFQQHQDDCQREIDKVLGRKTDDEFTGNTLDLGARDYRAH